MVTLRLRGIITPDKQLQVELPDDVTPGEVEVTVEIPEAPMSEEEIQEIMEMRKNARPLTGPEIAAMLETLEGAGWDHIQDGAKWVEEQRRKQLKESK